MPEPYTGVWKLSSLQLGNDLPTNVATVYRVQGRHHFADLRIPTDYPPVIGVWTPKTLLPLLGVHAFAGTITTGDTWIRWEPTMGFNPQAGKVNQGEIFFEGSELIEAGEWLINDEKVPYEERWIRQSSTPSDYCVLQIDYQINHTTRQRSYPLGQWVKVGHYFLRLIDFRTPRNALVFPELTQHGVDQLPWSTLGSLLKFEADFGCVNGTSWDIQVSNWPHRVGQSLATPMAYRIEYQPKCWVEYWVSDTLELIERRWRIIESSVAGS